jgi:starch synthase (maltosyl-transferring)
MADKDDVVEMPGVAVSEATPAGRALPVSAIYFVPREVLAPRIDEQVSRAAALGFDAVLAATPFLAEGPDAGGTVFVNDFENLASHLGGGDAESWLRASTSAARRAGLALLLDVQLGRVAQNAGLIGQNPDWFVHGGDGIKFRYLSAADATVDWWDERLAAWQAAGVRGFRFMDVADAPASVWRRLVAGVKRRDAQALCLAWSPGVAPDILSRLRNCGFDFAFSSLGWWDFAAGWLNDDAARVRAVAPVMAMPAPPGTAGWPRERVVRGMRLAAAYGAGWLLEPGFCAGFEDEVLALNRWRRRQDFLAAPAADLMSSAGAPAAVLRRGGLVLLANASLTQNTVLPAEEILPQLGVAGLSAPDESVLGPDAKIALGAGELTIFRTRPAKKMMLPVALRVDTNAARIGIEKIAPAVDDGRFPARRLVGEMVSVTADLISDGHGKLAAEVLFRAVDETRFRSVPMHLIVNDRWAGGFPLERMGRYVFAVAAWHDAFATFADEITKKVKASVNVSLEILEGMALVERAAAQADEAQAALAALQQADEAGRLKMLLGEEMAALMRRGAARDFYTVSSERILDAERRGAAFASWYEIFPRSQAGDGKTHGTFQDVIAQLPRIADMGFDVLYFPPIHPIGRTNRKGRNNTLTPAADDPGSPYAIGAKEGGHDVLHPELGTLDDFAALRAAAEAFGIELALDFAIQCAPDHPWLTEHPEWFDWRPDGSLRYAENPPKKYEDIVNVDFYAPGAQPSLWLALRDVVQFWVDQGVKLFRVDNPHTKPLPFWEWLIGDIRSRHPDALFLAEAFTRPKVMARLAKIGFSQSYTYFTWRNTKREIEDYLIELSATGLKDYFRPHFFVNTPDINPVFLQSSGRGGFLIRAALAATLSGLWGVYNGFELCEGAAIPGKEEYADSEKYQFRAWDYDRPGNIVAEISQLNRIRRQNAALHSHLGVEFLPCFHDSVVFFRKFGADGNNLLIAVSLDPHNIVEATLEVPLWRFGRADDGELPVEDLMRGFAFTWRGKYQPVRLNPFEQPFCIWRVAAPEVAPA